MKKTLLALAAAAAITPAFNANAQGNVSLVWKTAQIEGLSAGGWGGATTHWDTPDGIMAVGNMRFATAYDGKMYTINQKTMYISEITADGVKDVYQLPQPANTADFYGCAISCDEAGNFLLGMNFTQRPTSSVKFAVFNPSGEGENKLKEITLTIPDGSKIGRLDCIGRVLGDLTKEAYFLIPPEKGYDSNVRIVKSTGDGTVSSVAFEDVKFVDVAGNYTQQNIAQPAYHSLSAAGENAQDFYYASVNASNSYYAGYVNGALGSVAPELSKTNISSQNGFDSFTIGGKRYFVHSVGSFMMSLVVTDEEGAEICAWSNDGFTPNGGYSTIVTEPAEKDTYNIYVFNCTNSNGAAAMLNFDPTAPTVYPEGSKQNPYKLSTPEDVLAMHDNMKANGATYFVLENDIDMAGVGGFNPPLSNNPANYFLNKAIYVDGQNHVINNLTVPYQAYAGFLGVFGEGECKNLGLENITVTGWGAGGIGGFIGNTNYSGTAVVDNCFVTGKINGDSGFAGGLGGSNTGNAVITNSYADVTVSATALYSAGILGYSSGKSVKIENVYAAGVVTGSTSAGIVNITANPASASIKNAVALNSSVTGTQTAVATYSGTPATAEGVLYSAEMTVNGTAVTGGTAVADLKTTISGWEGFNNELNVFTDMPMLAWQKNPVKGESASYPVIISTPEDLAGMTKSLLAEGTTYFELANDIDMKDVAFTPGQYGTKAIHFDGKNHVISNLNAVAGNWGNTGLFGSCMGTIKNLGLVNVYSSTSGGCSGSFVGACSGALTISNCYATGKVYATAAGGFVGTNLYGELTISDSYANIEVIGDSNHFAGGFVGRIDKPLTITNSYVAGTVNAPGLAGGVGSIRNSNDVTLNNVVVYNSAIIGGTAAIYCAGLDAAMPDCTFWSGLKLNKAAVEGGKTQAELNTLITAWTAFNDKVNNGLPVLAWQEANGENTELPEIVYYGTKENPYKLSKAEDVVAMGSKLEVGENYFVVENDIDMGEVEGYTAPLGNNNYGGHVVFIDGKNHVISNLTCANGDYPSLIGVFMGEIKNLGLENVNITGGGVGPFGGFTGHASYTGTTTIENCFATGTIAGGSYAGGIGGYNNGTTVIKNCYSTVNVKGGGSGAGGVLGWNANGTLTIENVYAAGNVTGTAKAAGIIANVTGGAITLTNVAALNAEVKGATAAAVANDEVTATNALYVADMNVNDEAVSDGTPLATLKEAIMGWEAFNSTEVNATTKLPILAWQEGVNENESGIEDIEAADTNADAEYYNLQGVQVANPEGGIYIVRRGNKVTKELVK